jgi:hypothetical protein
MRMSLLLGLVLALAFATPVQAADPPFFETWGAGFADGGSLACEPFTEQNLTTPSEQVTCSANATAVWVCPDNTQTTVSAPVQAVRQFAVTDGQASGTLTLRPPGPSGFRCPGPQNPPRRPRLSAISYASVTLTGASGATAQFFTVGADDKTIVPSVFGPFLPIRKNATDDGQ